MVRMVRSLADRTFQLRFLRPITEPPPFNGGRNPLNTNPMGTRGGVLPQGAQMDAFRNNASEHLPEGALRSNEP